MASEAAHLKKAALNQAFLESIGDGYPEWLVTVAFYKAVHLAEALFAHDDGYHSTKHLERNQRLKRKYEDIWNEFKPLYDTSRMVRYSERGVSTAEAREHLIGKRLPAVERLITAALQQPKRK